MIVSSFTNGTQCDEQCNDLTAMALQSHFVNPHFLSLHAQQRQALAFSLSTTFPHIPPSISTFGVPSLHDNMTAYTTHPLDFDSDFDWSGNPEQHWLMDRRYSHDGTA
jgi:hypothetical protein